MKSGLGNFYFQNMKLYVGKLNKELNGTKTSVNKLLLSQALIKLVEQDWNAWIT